MKKYNEMLLLAIKKGIMPDFTTKEGKKRIDEMQKQIEKEGRSLWAYYRRLNRGGKK